MKRLMMLAALGLSGCVAGQDDAPVQFTSALQVTGAPGTECTADTNKSITRGRLNLAEGGNYTLAMQVRSIVPAGKPITVGGSTVTTGGEAATLTEFVYTYETSVPLGLPNEESVATYFVLKAGATEGYVFVNAFGPRALERLRSSGQVSDTPVSVVSTIKARGRLGTSGNLESNEFSFPVSVYNGTCPNGYTQTSVCNPGQDFNCVAPTTTP